jgi:hypothetical protein
MPIRAAKGSLATFEEASKERKERRPQWARLLALLKRGLQWKERSGDGRVSGPSLRPKIYLKGLRSFGNVRCELCHTVVWICETAGLELDWVVQPENPPAARFTLDFFPFDSLDCTILFF